MSRLQDRVAVITGAGRGIGREIALLMASQGAKIVVNDLGANTDGTGSTMIADDVVAEIKAAGGEAVSNTDSVADVAGGERLIQTAIDAFGGMDILVNNATMIHPELINPRPFWEKPLDAVGILEVGLRSAYVASWHAARIMVPQGSGLIAFGSSFGANCYMHGPGYGAQKAGIDKFAHDMQHDFTGSGVNAVSIWMGPLRTERALMAAEVHPEQYAEIMKVAENPEYTGHLLHALAFGNVIDKYAGQTLIGAELGLDLGIDDAGEYRVSHREML